MLETIDILEWSFEADPQATMQAHNRRAAGSPELCGCVYCRNFIALRETAYPEKFAELLTKLGIPKNFESYVYTYGEVEAGIYLYEGWFHFIGRVLKGSAILSFGTENGYYKGDPTLAPFSVFFNSSDNLVPESFPSSGVTQIEFSTRVPWILDEKPELSGGKEEKESRWKRWFGTASWPPGWHPTDHR